jgi:hypothetical protein
MGFSLLVGIAGSPHGAYIKAVYNLSLSPDVGERDKEPDLNE